MNEFSAPLPSSPEPAGEMPSRTSIWAASARALGARNADPVRRNPDYLAEKLLGAAERELIAGHPLYARLQHDPVTQGPYPEPPAMEVTSAVLTLHVRTCFIDEKLQAAIQAGARQVVVMGAGWDTRAHRFAGLLQESRIFEVDQPATQNRKKQRVQDALGGPPSNLVYTPIDFRVQKLGEVLDRAGYRSDITTFFIWEGVTMYLPETAVRETLEWVARQAPGSSIVFDFAGQTIIDAAARARNRSHGSAAEGLSEVERITMERLRMISAWGEPWIFGIPENGEQAFLQKAGLHWRETLVMASPAAARRYLGLDEGQVWDSPIRSFYFLAEARVSR